MPIQNIENAYASGACGPLTDGSTVVWSLTPRGEIGGEERHTEVRIVGFLCKGNSGVPVKADDAPGPL
jgi:hypothetical protein